MIHYIYISISIVTFFFGLGLGSHIERKEWNKLIKKGIINKPK